MTDGASKNLLTARFLEAMERNLNNLAEARDPQTVEVALELQTAIDRMRANVPQTGPFR